jgi:hypothetical protein
MKSETPAIGIMKTNVWDDAHAYNIQCSCSDVDHAVDAWIEVDHDKDIEEITVTFYVTTTYQGWKGLWERIKDATDMLCGKSDTRSHSLLLTKQAGLNFSDAIKQSIEDLDENS